MTEQGKIWAENARGTAHKEMKIMHGNFWGLASLMMSLVTVLGLLGGCGSSEVQRRLPAQRERGLARPLPSSPSISTALPGSGWTPPMHLPASRAPLSWPLSVIAKTTRPNTSTEITETWACRTLQAHSHKNTSKI